MGDLFLVDGYLISGDVGSLSRIGGGPAAMEMTGIDKGAFERFGGLRTGGIEFSSWFNDATGQEHDALSSLPTTDRIATYLRGGAVGSPGACCTAKQLNYDGNRGADGSLPLATTAESDGFGLEWGIQLTAGAHSATSSFDGTAVDTTASVSFGAQLYLQVVSFTGSSVFLGVSHSNDNAVTDPYAAIGGGAIEQEVTTAPGAYRLQTSRTQQVKRWIQFYAAGTFTQLTCVAVFVKNETSVMF
jgi:hypothetical protein